MKTALTTVRMRWSITWATIRSSKWQMVNYGITWLFALFLVFTVGKSAFDAKDALNGVSGIPVTASMLATMMVLIAFMLSIFVIVLQVLYIGQGSSLDPKRFELYGIPDAELQGGMLLSGLSGTPAVTCVLALLLWSVAYLPLGPAAFITGLCSALLYVVTLMCLSKLCVSLFNLAAHSTVVETLLSAALVVLISAVSGMFSGWSATTTPTDRVAALDDALAQTKGIASFGAWTPFAAAIQLPFDAAGGHWAALVVRLLILVATGVLCFLGSVWCLRFRRVHTPKVHEKKSVQGIGAFSWMPDSASGAMSARLATMMRHDPRQIISFAFPVLLTALFGFTFIKEGSRSSVWIALLVGGVFMVMCESNGLAYDGEGLTMQILAGTSGKDDRHAHVRLIGSLATVYVLAMAAVLLFVSGDWSSPQGWSRAFCAIAASLAIPYAMLGLAEVTSCTMLYPVPSIERPMNTPQGRATAQLVFPLVYFLLSAVVMIPAIATAIVGLFLLDFGNAYFVTLGLVALANGLIVLAAGTAIGGRILDKRQLRILETLQAYATLQQ